MKLRRQIAAVLCAFLIFSMPGCAGLPGSSSKTVYFASHDVPVDFMASLYEGVKRQGQELGLTVEYMNAKLNSDLQLQQVNQAIESGAAAIVLLPVDGLAIVPAVQKANRAKIPVIATNRDLDGGEFAQVMSDEKQAGILQGEYMAKHLPQGAKVVYLMGDANLRVAALRWEGFKEACLDKRPDVQLLMSQDCGWLETSAFSTVSVWMKMFPQIDGVIAANDSMALGALRALKADGREKGVLISGVDALEPAIQAVAAGEMAQTVKQDADKTAEEIGKLLKKVRSGKIPTEKIMVPFTEITRENAAQFQ